MRKNILIFGHSYATQFIDISNQYTQLFDKNFYEVTVAYLAGETDEQVRQKHTAEHVLFLNSPKKSIRGLKIDAIQQIIRLCREKKFEIVICHRYKPTYVMLWAALFCKIPAVFFVMHELRTLSHLARKILIALLAKKNMIFAGVSDAVRNDMRRDIWGVPPERVITLHNMIDVEYTESHLFSREVARAKLDLPKDAFIFGNIARLAKNKDQTSLIHAFANIKSSCPLAKLVIMGDGLLESDLKAQAAQLGLKEDVIFTGYIPDAFRYVKALDIFVLSSTQEAFGRVLLEAMIGKIPVIATRINGIPEVVGDAGLLSHAAQPAELAALMLEFYQLSDQQRETWGQRSYDRAVKHFSFQRFNEIVWQLPLLTSLKESV